MRLPLPLPSVRSQLALAAATTTLLLTACGDTARLTEAQVTGPAPTLAEPVQRLIPTVHIAPAKGWPEGAMPTAPAGWKVTALARGLEHPRWLHVLPNGDVLVAESNAPPKPADNQGIKAKVQGWVMKRAGAGVPSANRITLLRDADGDGVAETKSVFLAGLHSPFGMALVGNELFVANTDGVLRFPYTPGQTAITAAGTRVTDLPAGPRNHHWTKALIASRDGTKLYATVGSNSNVAEHGLAEEEGRAAIWEIDRATGAKRLYATGLRNPNGMGFEPSTGTLWTVVNERDEIGSDLVPDYLTSVQDGQFYGWPWSYYGQVVDIRVQPPAPDKVAAALKPEYALGAHVAPLGMAFADGRQGAYASGVFVGEHGSWNRKPRSGYKLTFVPFANGKPQGAKQDVLTGFVDADGNALGRPVGVAIAASGAVLVADDVGNTVWALAVAR